MHRNESWIISGVISTKEFIGKTTFSSFHGLTGPECFRDRKTLDARLSLSPQVVSGETSGMTYKDVVCAVTNGRISDLAR